MWLYLHLYFFRFVQQNAPIIASPPHFLGVDADIQAGVEGLNPDPERHVTKLNIEPSTGLLLQAKKRIQYNVLIEKIEGQVS